MVRKLITVGIVVISFLFQGLGISDIVMKDAYAQTKTGTVKKPAVEKKKAEKAQPQKPDDFSFAVKEFPDGVIGRRYNFVLTPKEATPPYKVTIAKGSLPPGITVNQRTGGIEGEPAKVGAWPLTLSLTDAKGKRGTFAGVVTVWRVLSVGEHGKFKGFDGLQMALNMAQDMDELRIEKGIIYGSGLVIPSNKAWAHGIKISGGWDEAFEEKNNNPEDTVLDGGGRKDRILKIGNSAGIVSVENLKFTNSTGVEIAGASAVFTNCAFTNNGAGSGGAVLGNGTFTNCTFMNNWAGEGGAVLGNGTFTNCTFTNNRADRGGAVSGDGTFTNCTFTNNRARAHGGAVYGAGTFTNCTFMNNSAAWGGAFHVTGLARSVNGTFTNCTFMNNSSTGGGAVYGAGTLTFTNCTFMNNSASAASGGAVYGAGTFTNCTLYGNLAKEHGGAISGEGVIINSIFYKNIAGGKDNDIFVEGMTGMAYLEGNLKVDYSLVNYMSGAADFGANNIMGDPKFVDPDSGDLRLRSDSPGINAGKITPEIKNSPFDLDGKPRIVGGKIDMGAYEWQGNDKMISSTPIDASTLASIEKNMVFVKGGCYEMGDTFETRDIFTNEKIDREPRHNVCVDDFYIGKYEVTQRQWVAVMETNPSNFKGCDNCPVDTVSWDDIQHFIGMLNQKTGKKYRFPTEAEWEYAARSGGKNEKWAGTSNEGELEEYAWFNFNSGGKTHLVGQKKPNGLGLYDMSGNVWERVSDWYDLNYYRDSPKDNPKGPSSGQWHVLRGGDETSPSPWFARASLRVTDFEGGDSPSYIGFRLAREK